MLTDLFATLADFVDATTWMDDALCGQTDPEVFFAPFDAGPGWETAAKQICRGCEARAACLHYALDHQIPYGVWGGWTEQERQKALEPPQAA